ncbi:uncharacterized protein LOC134773139 [Penaeus indicus]|uniref:uncharacterized protein LOC134773139 n=1 Tax=Penaeus indicus TaxID=29960 RepID=UPI00300C249B
MNPEIVEKFLDLQNTSDLRKVDVKKLRADFLSSSKVMGEEEITYDTALRVLQRLQEKKILQKKILNKQGDKIQPCRTPTVVWNHSMAGAKEELADLTTRLDTVSRKYGMEISAEKSKTMVTSRTGDKERAADVQIKVGDAELEEIQSFKYLGSTLNESVTSETEIKKRLAIATNQFAKLYRIWSSSAISTAVKIRLLKSLITSIAPYGCEAWTHSKALEKRISAFELRCFRRVLGITWRQKITNVEVRRRITNEIGTFEPLLETARRRKLQWFGHTSREIGTLAFDVMHVGVEGSRGRGRLRRSWLSDIGEWPGRSVVGCLREAQDRGRWRRIVYLSKCPNGHQATGVT